MKKVILSVMAGFPLLIVAACNNGGKSSTSKADSVNSVKRDSGQITMNKDEAQFMVQAADGGLLEVTMGKIAQQKAQNKRVKAFADMMVQDHSLADAKLKAIAESKNVTLPDSLSEKSRDQVDKLNKVKGRDFDKKYMSMMLDDHQKDVRDFQNELDKAKDADLLDWIRNTESVISKHLDSAKAINSLYGYKGDSSSRMPSSPVPH